MEMRTRDQPSNRLCEERSAAAIQKAAWVATPLGVARNNELQSCLGHLWTTTDKLPVPVVR